MGLKISTMDHMKTSFFYFIFSLIFVGFLGFRAVGFLRYGGGFLSRWSRGGGDGGGSAADEDVEEQIVWVSFLKKFGIFRGLGKKKKTMVMDDGHSEDKVMNPNPEILEISTDEDDGICD